MNQTQRTGYDIIGDIHGYAGQLKGLLSTLGYEERDGCYRHLDRRAIFLGDFVDRGPEIRETLRIARSMVEGGSALAVMGNHELNAIAYHTPDGNGGHLRPRTEKNIAQHAETLQAFEGREDELQSHLEWFKTLPLFLDLGELRIVHACWKEQAINELGGSSRFDASLLFSNEPNGYKLRHEAVNTLLKGPEIPVPGGREYGGGRREMRVQWWRNEGPMHYRNIALQVPLELPDEPLTDEELKTVCGYAAGAPPVFFGHYGYRKPPEPIATNVCCVDLGVTRGGPLCAYCWDGETVLQPGKFVGV